MAKLNFDATTRPVHVEPTRKWSVHQERVFNFVEHGVGNAIVEAVAGSGKTTTIVEALNRVSGSSIFLAFNKSIADELKARGVNARTFHSLTYGPVMQSRKQHTVESNKLRKLCDQYMTGEDKELYGAFAQRLVGLARQQGVGFLVADVQQTWIDLCDHHNIELDSEFADFGRGIELASKLLDASNASPMVDFDDMLYFAVRDGLVLPKYDFIFVDEAQDTNAIQRAILRKIMHAGTRIVAVGDPAQAIYGFRGADSNSLDLIATEFNATRLPLSISYRCPQAVVNFARQWVSHIEPAPSAPEGSVEDMGGKWDTSVFQPNDLVVCRTTAPIITLAYSMLKSRVPVRVMGREIGQGLKNLINKQNAHTIDALVEKLEAFRTREVEKATAKMEEAKAEAINDKVDAIVCLIDGLTEDDRSIRALMNVIDTLFAEGVNKTVLATIHKAKGLEADRVFWLNSSACPAKWARQDWQKQQELNLCYVAVTRAKQSLFLIEAKEK